MEGDKDSCEEGSKTLSATKGRIFFCLAELPSVSQETLFD
jgi:hypothetical protein